MPSVKALKQRLADLKTARTPYDHMYTILGQYFLSKVPNFSGTITEEGVSQMNSGIWDTTGIRSVRSFVSALIGAVWKGEGRTFRLKKPDFIRDTKENKEYYEWLTKKLASLIDEPPSGILPALTEAGTEFAVYGTGAAAVEPSGDFIRPFNFKSWTFENIYYDIGKDGNIASVYYRARVSVREVVETYGKKNVSRETLTKYNGDKREEKIIIVEGVEPRALEDRKDKKTGLIFAGQQGMPYVGYVFEEDTKEEKFLEEKGYDSIPIKIARCYVQPGQAYPRSLAMDALPSVVEANAHRESLVVGGEMKAQPPVVVFDDGSLAGGNPDLGPRGINVFNASGQLGAGIKQPIMPIFTVGELQSLAAILEKLTEEIAQHLLIDRLFDLNNKTRMTLGEAEMRYSIRNDALGPIYIRVINGWITPILVDCFNIAFEMGLLGVESADDPRVPRLLKNGIDAKIIPVDIARAMREGKDVYKIEYISPAASILRSETYRGTIEMVNVMMSVGQTKREVLDRLDADKLVDLLPDMTGGDPAILSSLEDAQKIRDARQQLEQELLKIQAQGELAKANQSNAQAQASRQNIQQQAVAP